MTTLENKNILVTGGAGFVGSNLVKTLASLGANVTVLDDLFTGTEENLAGVPHRFVLGSVENKELVRETVKGMQIVFHLAARNIIISNNNPREDLNVNVGGSFNVFEACLEHDVERVVYTSTSSIYGNPTKLPIQEGDKKSFLNFYSAGKYSAEVYARTFYEVFGLPVTIVRYSNIYGRNQAPTNPYCGVIGKFLDAAINGKPLKVHGDGEQTRDYTYIDDAVDATIAAALSRQAIGGDYNIGTGTETSVMQLANTIIELTESNSPIRHVENRDIDNIRRRRIDISKTVKELQYKPNYTIEQGLKATVKWFLHSIRGTAAGLLTVANFFEV